MLALLRRARGGQENTDAPSSTIASNGSLEKTLAGDRGKWLKPSKPAGVTGSSSTGKTTAQGTHTGPQGVTKHVDGAREPLQRRPQPSPAFPVLRPTPFGLAEVTRVSCGFAHPKSDESFRNHPSLFPPPLPFFVPIQGWNFLHHRGLRKIKENIDALFLSR